MRPLAKFATWTSIRSKQLICSPFLSVWEHALKTSDGHILDPYFLTKTHDFVLAVVIDSRDRVWLLDHYRPGIASVQREIPAGLIDGNENPEQTVVRELQEEIGYTGGQIYLTAQSYFDSSRQSGKCYSFLALGGDITTEAYDEPGANFIPQVFTVPELLADISSSSTSCAYPPVVIASIYYGIDYLKKLDNPQSRRLRTQL